MIQFLTGRYVEAGEFRQMGTESASFHKRASASVIKNIQLKYRAIENQGS